MGGWAITGDLEDLRTNPFGLILCGIGHPILLLFNTLYPDFVGERESQRLTKPTQEEMDTTNEKESTEKQLSLAGVA